MGETVATNEGGRQPASPKPTADVRKEWRKRGTPELDFWASCLRARNEGVALFAMPSSTELEAQVSEDIEFAKSRAQKDPRRLPSDLVRFLNVESAFTAMAARSARDVFGEWRSLNEDGRKNWEAFVRISRRKIRGVCLHMLVHKRPAGQWRDLQAFAVMATYGRTVGSFEKFVRYTLDDVRETLGRK